MDTPNFYIRKISGSRTWPIRHRVMYPEMSPESVILPQDREGMHFGLFLPDDRLIAVISLFEGENGHYQFRKFATENAEQGKGYGTALLTYIIDLCRCRNATRLWCNARISASAFYSRYGFTKTDITFSKDGHDFVIMERMF